MNVHVVTLFPELTETVVQWGVAARAVERGLLDVKTWNPRDFTDDVHRTVDDRAYGGGPGMVLKVAPLRDAVLAAKAQAPAARVVCLSPQGRPIDQALLQANSAASDLILVCGRYEGIDERFIAAHVDEEWSLGDYVISGGELAAMVVIDALARLQPGALGDELSSQQDSFSDGLLDCPHYTRPEVDEGVAVPAVLLSGDHAAIARWRREQALIRTAERRPDLLRRTELSEADRRLLDEHVKRAHGVAGAGDGNE